MTPLGSRPLLRLLALLAGVVLAPAVARAECGDYVHMAGKSAPTAAALADPGKTDFTAADQHQAEPNQPRRPCRGPLCSQGRLPPLAPPASVTVPHEQWGCPAPSLSSLATEAVARPWDEPARHPVRNARTIYHPPRLGSCSPRR
jgi:hypothetical protein